MGYIPVIILTYIGFAAIFLFLHINRPSGFLKLFAIAWGIEALRASLLLAAPLGMPLMEIWWVVDDLAYLPVTCLLVAAVAGFTGIQIPRSWFMAYLAIGSLVVILTCYGLHWFYFGSQPLNAETAAFYCLLFRGIAVFLTGALARLWIMTRLLRYWKETALPGALIAAISFGLHSLGALSALVEGLRGEELLGSQLFWSFEVLVVSIGIVILVLNKQQADLQKAISQVRTLRGLLPICMSCKKIRDDRGYWNQVEVYISSRSEAEFTHGICPECIERLYPGV